MGRVLLAIDEQFGREVAVKELLPGLSGSQSSKASRDFAERFLREARVTGRLEHPGIIPVYEIGQRVDGSAFYSMKFIHGESLYDRLRKINRRDDIDASAKMKERLKLLDHFIDICEAIAYAHSKGVIHRDLKPDNVMLGDFGETLVVDWGLAKVLGQADTPFPQSASAHDLAGSRTVTGSVLGTPAYMPPEQAKGELEEVDGQSDVYSLGVMLYVLLTGTTPFTGSSMPDILRKVLTQEAPSIRELQPDAPRELISLCERMMAREKSERLHSAKQAADEVRAYREGRALSTYAYSIRELLARYIKRNKRAVAVAAVAFVLLCLAGIGFWVREIQREAQEREEFELLVQARKDKLDAAAQSAVAMDIKSILERIETLSIDLLFADLDDDPFALGPAIARNNALTPARREEALRAVQDALTWAQAQRARLQLARDPIAGKHVDLLTEEEFAKAHKAQREAENTALVLALLAEHHSAAQTALVSLDLTPEERASHEAHIATASNSLVNAWSTLARAAVEDMEAGRGRLGREDEFRQKYGMAALNPDEWVKRLIGFRHEKVAQTLADLLRPYTEKARLDGPSVRWTDPDRDALQVILETLGDIQQPQVAVPALGEFLHEAYDAFFASEISGARASVVVTAGLALCATESEAADLILREVLQGRLINSPESQQIERRMSRIREGAGIEEPEDAASYNERAVARYMRGDSEGAISDYTKAIELDPNFVAAWLNRGRALHAIGDSKAALIDYNRAIELAPQVPQSWINRGTLRYEAGNFEGAASDFDQAILLQPRSVDAWFNRGNARARLGDQAGAFSDYSQAIELRPNAPQFWINRGNCRERLGDTEGTMKDYEQAISVDPQFAIAWNARGFLKFLQGNTDEALRDFSQAITLDPSLLSAWCHRARLRINIGDGEGALADLDQAFELAPNDFQVWYSRALVHRGMKNFDAAMEDFSQCIKINPGFSDAWAGRGTLRYDQFGDAAGAVSDLTRAVKLDPQYSNAWMYLGNIRKLQDRPADALRHWLTAYEVATASWSSLENLEKARTSLLEYIADQGAIAVLEIATIEDGYQAKELGLKPFDVITAIDNEPITGFEFTTGIDTFGAKMGALDKSVPHTLTVRRYKRNAVLNEMQLTLLRDASGSLILDDAGKPQWEHEELTVTIQLDSPIGVWLAEQYLPQATRDEGED